MPDHSDLGFEPEDPKGDLGFAADVPVRTPEAAGSAPEKGLAERLLDKARSLSTAYGNANDAFVRHLGQGVTFGFGDELGARLQQGLAAISGDKEMDPDEVYKQALNENRSELAHDEQEHPLLSGAGELIGGLMVPVPGLGEMKGAVGLGKSALLGAGMGALAGAGNSTEGHRLEGAGVGGVVGGALGGAFHALGSLAGKAGEAGNEAADELAQKIGQKDYKVAKAEAARQNAVDSDAYQQRLADLKAKLDAAKQEAGVKVKKSRAQIDLEQAEKDVARIPKRVEGAGAKAQQMQFNRAYQNKALGGEQYLDTIAAGHAEELPQQYAAGSNEILDPGYVDKVKAEKEADLKDAADVARRKAQAQIDAQSPLQDLLAQVRELRKPPKKFAPLPTSPEAERVASEKAEAQIAKSSPLSLLPRALAEGGALGVAGHFLGPAGSGAGGIAGFAHGLSKAMSENPAAAAKMLRSVGKAAPLLQAAAQRGPAAIISTLQALSSDPVMGPEVRSALSDPTP